MVRQFWSGSISSFHMNTFSRGLRWYSRGHSLISFRTDWFDFIAVQGILKNLLQHHYSKTSILRCSPFFIVQISHLYMATAKTIALTIWTFVGNVMSLLLINCLGFVIAFLPRIKHLLILQLQLQPAVILELKKKINICHCFHFPPIYLHEVMGSDAMILVFWMLSFKPVFSFVSFTLIKILFSSSSLSAIRVLLSEYWGFWYFSQ